MKDTKYFKIFALEYCHVGVCSSLSFMSKTFYTRIGKVISIFGVIIDFRREK